MLAWYSDMQERMKLVEGKECQAEKQHIQVVAQERQVEDVTSFRVRGKGHSSSCTSLSGSGLPAEVRSPCRIGYTKDTEAHRA